MGAEEVKSFLPVFAESERVRSDLEQIVGSEGQGIYESLRMMFLFRDIHLRR